ncbi:hypothetical protein [Sphingobium sp.]|uniref:allophanate hydrolase-related protein n=1 Tax=Sphingobium sp. TaxID=1912891 RepID=UPI0035C67C29
MTTLIGYARVSKADGSQVQGFACEALATADAADISHHGSWRAYMASLRPA